MIVPPRRRRHHIRRRSLGVPGAVLALGLLVGCSSYAGLSEKTRPHLVRRDYAGALAELEDVEGGKDRVLVLLERGLLHHYNGDFDASNAVFQEAEDLIDELYTKSISTEVAALVTNDLLKPYDGAEFERVMVHVYRALNYIALDQPDGALVEARKANLALDLYTQDLENPAYGDDPFVEYVTGLLYEWNGEWNDAFVSYQRAIDAYAAAHEQGGPPVPRSLASSALGAARKLGFIDEMEALGERFSEASPPSLGVGEGEAIILVETGFVPQLVEARADVPILESDDVGKDRVFHVAGTAYHRIGHHYDKRKVKLKYILSIAYPVFAAEPPAFGSVALVQATETQDLASTDAPSDEPAVTLSSPRELEIVSDLAFNAHENFEDREPSILVRTIARALLKYIAKKQAEDAGGGALGLAVDIFGSLTERADTRSWRSLPRDIHLLRVPLPAGTQDLVFRARGPRGEARETVTLRGVHVREGETTWVSYRLY